MKEFERRNDNRILEKPFDRVKEFPGYEIEIKLQLLSPFYRGLVQELRDVIVQNGEYRTITGLDDLFWVFDFDYYGYREDKEIKMALVLIHHPSTPKFWVRKKGKPTAIEVELASQSVAALKRTETNILVEESLFPERRREILEREQKEVGKDIFLVGTVSREKHYFFIENPKTTRAYSVSLDLCSCRDRRMSQLEIEYKWIRGQEVPMSISDKSIREDLTLLTSVILDSNLGPKFVPTRLTKWEWALEDISSYEQGGV
jgi:hypothetical protein